MYLFYGVLILAMIFFFVLPVTDARTARMKLSVMSSLGIAGGIGCRAAPVALTKDLPASTRNDQRLSEGRRLVDADGGSA
jgi:hypothetical protein